MYLIALTGGIASGKSAVAARLVRLGAVHVDADLLAREVVAPGTPGLAEIAEEFGPEVLLPDGSLDRAALGAIVFADPQRRRRLNEITHPRVRALAARRIADARVSDPDAVVVYDVPLLAESGGERGEFDAVLVVHADRAERLRRMVELRAMSVEDAAARIAAQASDEERLAIADVVIENSGTLDELDSAVDAFWAGIREQVAVRPPSRDVGGPA